ncbi:MAG: M56 family metallopeptidase, partial [Muribaculaceae bacterium]|nr:M56 family metallopeptidase [Muribaculaceae bacterium]
MIGIPQVVSAKPIWGTVLIWIFMAGMVVVGLRTVATWIRLVRVISSGRKERHGDYILVVIDDCRIAPFSWMRYMVINSDDYAACPEAIITHELNHIRRCHWVDLFVAQMVVIVNWFNPAAWLMRDELMLIHEYQSDMAVIDGGHDPREYQMLLIKKAVGARFPSLANSLNHSKLKKRITMMYQKKSGKSSRFKALALVPACALALSVTAIPAVKAAITTIDESPVASGKGSEKSSESQTFGTALEQIKVVGYGQVKKDSKDLAGNAGISSVILYGKSISNEKVTIICDGKEISDEQMNNIDPKDITDITVKRDPDIVIINTRSRLGEIYDSSAKAPEVLPVYKGGEADLYRELAMNLRYPMEAAKNGITGKAVVEFLILADGTLTGARILQSSGHDDLDVEAIRAVNSLNEGWTPGMSDGKPVNCTFALPVNFSLKKD